MALQVVKPRIRGFICTSAHPIGCHENVKNQIDYIKKNIMSNGENPNVLVIGASRGYGLASRIALAWGYGAKTIGVFFESPASARRTATAGYYNSIAFHQQAQQDGLFAGSFNGDAFSDEMKRDVINRVKQIGEIDFLVYSLAAPRRTNPRTGTEHIAVLKPIGQPYTGRTIDLRSDVVTEITIEPANDKEIADTVAVMGGEDLEFWVDALLAENLLSEESTVIAYDYVGPKITWPIYLSGTIGKAKEDLMHRTNKLNEKLANQLGGHAYLSVNKAIVSQASMAIPVVPLYMSILFDVMKTKGVDENPIGQMARLFSEHLGPNQSPTLDADRRVRLDDRERRDDVVAEVMDRWERIDTENLNALSDYEGLKREFRNLFGFEVEGIDYDEAVETELILPGF